MGIDFGVRDQKQIVETGARRQTRDRNASENPTARERLHQLRRDEVHVDVHRRPGHAEIELARHRQIRGQLRILEVAAVQSSPAMGINMWYAYLAVPVGAALMLLESVLKLGEAVRALWRPV